MVKTSLYYAVINNYEFYKYRDGEIFKLAEGDFPEGNILALHRS
jgi:hypothetical protein